jgi:hypothetical protein
VKEEEEEVMNEGKQNNKKKKGKWNKIGAAWVWISVLPPCQLNFFWPQPTGIESKARFTINWKEE